jgi:hypothetical protein
MASVLEPSTNQGLDQSLLDDFEERWKGANDPTWSNTVQHGAGNHQEGIHSTLLVATFLDPRFKMLVSVPDQRSKVAIYKKVLQLMVESEDQHQQNLLPAAAPAPAPNAMEEEEQDAEDADDPFAIMASEIAAAEADSRNDTVISAEDFCKDELNRYKNIASLPLHCRELGSLVFNDPLHWCRASFPFLQD